MMDTRGPADAAPHVSCVLTAEPAAGPFALPLTLKRSDLRADLSTGARKDGVPLRLKLTFHRVDGGARTPLAGAYVDVWHCDATGAYGDGFLRGWQVTDEHGMAEFVTVFPGWYPSRAVHLHFRLWIEDEASRAFQLEAEIFFDEDLTHAVNAQSPYSIKGQPDTPNHTDCVYTTLSPDEQAALTVHATRAAGGGYDTEVTLGVRVP